MSQFSKWKRIYRDEMNGKIAGICAGVADMMDFDPTLVRLALVFLCLVTGVWPLVITYLAGWYIIPDKSELKTP